MLMMPRPHLPCLGPGRPPPLPCPPQAASFPTSPTSAFINDLSPWVQNFLFLKPWLPEAGLECHLSRTFQCLMSAAEAQPGWLWAPLPLPVPAAPQKRLQDRLLRLQPVAHLARDGVTPEGQPRRGAVRPELANWKCDVRGCFRVTVVWGSCQDCVVLGLCRFKGPV